MSLDGLLFSEEQWTPGEKEGEGLGRQLRVVEGGKAAVGIYCMRVKKEKTFTLF